MACTPAQIPCRDWRPPSLSSLGSLIPWVCHWFHWYHLVCHWFHWLSWWRTLHSTLSWGGGGISSPTSMLWVASEDNGKTLWRWGLAGLVVITCFLAPASLPTSMFWVVISLYQGNNWLVKLVMIGCLFTLAVVGHAHVTFFFSPCSGPSFWQPPHIVSVWGLHYAQNIQTYFFFLLFRFRSRHDTRPCIKRKRTNFANWTACQAFL